MTTVAACEYRGQVWIGGDSAATDENQDTVELLEEPKVWLAGGCAWGGAGDSRYLDLVHYMTLPKLPRAYKSETRSVEAIRRWFVHDLANAIREAWKPDLEFRSSKSPLPACALLIGVRGRVYQVFEDFSFGRPLRGYSAIGTGDSHALAHLDATAKRRMRPKERLAEALTVASERTTIVRPPFRYVHA